MKNLINDIVKIMAAGDMSTYALAKTSGISKSTLYKALQFERTLSPKHFYKIVDNLPTTISVKKALIERFQAINSQKSGYSLQEGVLGVMRSIFNTDKAVAVPKVDPPRPLNDAFDALKSLKGTTSVATAINLALIEEMGNKNPTAYTYIPGNNSLIPLHIDSTVKTYNTNIKINFLLDLLNSKEEGTGYNLNLLKNIIPMIMSGSENYSFYYSYVNEIYEDSLPVQYPYFFVCSGTAVYINYSLDEAVLAREPGMVKRLLDYCQKRLSHYSLLNHSFISTLELIEAYNQNQEDFNSFYTLEYDPCYLKYITKAMVDYLIYPDLPIKEPLSKVILTRISQLGTLRRSIQFFNPAALMQFAHEGKLTVAPDYYVRPCTYEQRLYLLEQSYKDALGDNHLVRAIRTNAVATTIYTTVSVQNNGFLQISTFDSARPEGDYVLITEPSLCGAFQGFFKNVDNYGLLYTKEETLALYEEAMAYLRKKIEGEAES